MRVVITGGAGFIGHNIVKKLVNYGFNVLVIDNLLRPSPVGLRVIKDLGVRLARVDVTNYNALLNILTEFKPEAVIHAAALVDVAESIERPELYAHVNVEGTACVAKASIKSGVNLIIYLSSAAVYGHPKILPISEDHPVNPISPYGASKLAGEYIIKSLRESVNRLNYVIFRLFNVYGSGQNPSSPYSGVITKFINAAMKGRELVIYGDGEQTRDFIHVNDVAEAVIKALSLGGEAVNEVINLGSGVETSINELAKIVINELRVKAHIKYEAPRPGDIRRSVASIRKAREFLGWTPRIDLRKGIKELINEMLLINN